MTETNIVQKFTDRVGLALEKKNYQALYKIAKDIQKICKAYSTVTSDQSFVFLMALTGNELGKSNDPAYLEEGVRVFMKAQEYARKFETNYLSLKGLPSWEFLSHLQANMENLSLLGWIEARKLQVMSCVDHFLTDRGKESSHLRDQAVGDLAELACASCLPSFEAIPLGIFLIHYLVLDSQNAGRLRNVLEMLMESIPELPTDTEQIEALNQIEEKIGWKDSVVYPLSPQLEIFRPQVDNARRSAAGRAYQDSLRVRELARKAGLNR